MQKKLLTFNESDLKNLRFILIPFGSLKTMSRAFVSVSFGSEGTWSTSSFLMSSFNFNRRSSASNFSRMSLSTCCCCSRSICFFLSFSRSAFKLSSYATSCWARMVWVRLLSSLSCRVALSHRSLSVTTLCSRIRNSSGVQSPSERPTTVILFSRRTMITRQGYNRELMECDTR